MWPISEGYIRSLDASVGHRIRLKFPCFYSLEFYFFVYSGHLYVGASGDVEQLLGGEAGAEPAGPLLPHQQLPEAERVPDLRLIPSNKSTSMVSKLYTLMR